MSSNASDRQSSIQRKIIKFDDMKEQIYEIAKKYDDDRYLAWHWFKKLDLGLSRYLFHKYCGELVDEKRLKKKNGLV